jgi:hypothetical protein
MPNELIGHLRGLPSTVRARLHKGSQTFNVSTGAWVNFSAGSWAQYLVTMAPDPGTGVYFGDLPTAAADAEYVTFYEGTALGVVLGWQILRLGGPFAATGITGQTMRAILKNGLLTWRRTTSTWVAHNDADWADYLITTTEDAGTGVYSAALPAGAESWTHIRHHNGVSAGEADLVQFRNTTAAVPIAGLSPVSISFDSTTPAPEPPVEPLRIYRGAGAPVYRFVPTVPFTTSAAHWSCRIGTRSSTLITLTSGGGLTVDETNGTIIANPTAAQTATLPLDKVCWLELWRIGAGDDNTAPVVRRKLQILRTLS